MILPILSAFLAALALAGPASAEYPQTKPHHQSGVVPVEVELSSTDRILQLSQTMQIKAVLEVMREEGLDYGDSLEVDMFPGKGGAAWRAIVEDIYDDTALLRQFDAALAAELADTDVAMLDVMEGFFASTRGQRILMLEVEARRALLNQETEDAAKVNVDEMAANDDPRLALIRDFAQANDLIEMNVAGALNANLAFFKGMAEAGAFDDEMTEDQMLSSVWEQEPAIRAETETWLYPYLALAYQPLTDDDMTAYLAFSQTVEGQVLNAAVFAAFNVLFTSISTDLGRAAAAQMRGEDI